MNFKFSFSEKHELIYISNTQNISEVGSLIKDLVDADWLTLQAKVEAEIRNANEQNINAFQEVQHAVMGSFSHPAVIQELTRASDLEELLRILQSIKTGSEMLSYILETLVDEEQSLYEEQLLSLLNDAGKEELKSFLNTLGPANVLTVYGSKRVEFYPTKEFPFLFETDDVLRIAIQELQYMCANRFYIRKCALCKKFLWTRKMNKVYCDRTIAYSQKTCAQTGPAKLWLVNKPKAYALYWTYRKRLFKRATNEENECQYHRWLDETQVYRDLAKMDKISCEDMRKVLDEIEDEVYAKASGL